MAKREVVTCDQCHQPMPGDRAYFVLDMDHTVQELRYGGFSTASDRYWPRHYCNAVCLNAYAGGIVNYPAKAPSADRDDNVVVKVKQSTLDGIAEAAARGVRKLQP